LRPIANFFALDTRGVQEALALPPSRLPSWLIWEGNVWRVLGTPQRREIDPDIREQLIVEFYSR
jgi:hypothetical protein